MYTQPLVTSCRLRAGIMNIELHTATASKIDLRAKLFTNVNGGFMRSFVAGERTL